MEQKTKHAWKDTDIVEIENPMKMSYREAYAWQLGWEQGWKAREEKE